VNASARKAQNERMFSGLPQSGASSDLGVIAAVLPGRARPLALVQSLAGDTTRAPVTLHQVSL